MRFGVLGPIEVWTTAGRPVKVPELKVRALLAVLLSQRGQVVPSSRLIEDLWGAELPVKPIGSLHAKISQLRRALENAEPGGRDLIVSHGAGYELRVGPDAVDADRFLALMRNARAIEDPRVRAARLGDALALWRGPALADFREQPFAQPVVARLEEERLVALEDQVETRLALGEHSLLIGTLGDLVSRYPLRERLRATQLRALYLAGRPAEALASFVDLRSRLAEELGSDPSPELVALNQAILRQDPELSTRPAPDAAVRGRGNLPTQPTALIGRAGALDEVYRLLEEHRIVTLTGAGGVGKTRLAIAVAARVCDDLPDGAWLVELAALRKDDATPAVAERVMAALDVREDPPGPAPTGMSVEPVDRLIGALAGRRMLLVLDNCEHVVESVARLAAALLAAAPHLRLLVTSQEPVALAGEAVWVVPPLRLPDESASPEPAELARFSAVEFFVARAAATASGFTLDAGNAAAVAAICRRLDGIPLALELAATRVRALGVHELLARLTDRFRLLASGYRSAPPRQQTLRAMIDWSWDLLTDPERVVLRRLAIHAEGCTLEAAEAVCADDGVRPEAVLDLLARLVDRSVVVMTDGPYGPRYRLLESVAAYCRSRLEEAGELATVRARHNEYYVALAVRGEPALRGPDQRQWLERLDGEAANLRVALDGAVDRGAAVQALRLVNALSWYWFLRGRLHEGHRSLRAALEVRGPAPELMRGATEAWAAGMALLVNVPDAMERKAPEPPEPGPDDVDEFCALVRAQWFLAFAEWYTGALDASEKRVDWVLANFRAIGDRWGVAAVLSTRAALAAGRGDLTALRRNGEDSAALFVEIGDRWGQLKATEALGVLAEISGRYDDAVRLHRDGLFIAEDLGLWTEVAYKLSMLGRIALLTSDLEQAAELHRRSMRLAAEQSNRLGEEFAEIGLALGARRQGRLDEAERHLRRWVGWLRQLRADNGLALIFAELGFIAEQRGDVELARATHLDGLAAAEATGDTRAVALALEGLAGVLALAGAPGHAARLLGAAAQLRDAAGAPLPAAERGDVDRITATATAAIGAVAFADELARGRESDLVEAVELARKGAARIRC